MKRANSTAILMYLRILVKRSIPSDHASVVWLFIDRLFGDTKANASRVGCSNIPSSILFWGGLMTITKTLTTQLLLLQTSKSCARESTENGPFASTQDTKQLRNQIWSMGACGRMHRPELFRVHLLPRAETHYCEPHAWNTCSKNGYFLLDTDGIGYCSCVMQTCSSCLALQETNALPSRCSRWRRSSSGKRRIGQEAVWKLEYDFPSGQWKRRAPLLWDDLAVRPERSWLHSLRNWQKRIWWSHGHTEVIPLQALMGFRVVSTSVREAYVLNFSTTRTHTCLRVALSQLKLPTAELWVFPSLSTSTTMEGSW